MPLGLHYGQSERTVLVIGEYVVCSYQIGPEDNEGNVDASGGDENCERRQDGYDFGPKTGIMRTSGVCMHGRRYQAEVFLTNLGCGFGSQIDHEGREMSCTGYHTWAPGKLWKVALCLQSKIMYVDTPSTVLCETL